jgi:hypothetical protein
MQKFVEKPSVKALCAILGREKYCGTKPEEKADSRNNNEFCIDKGIEYE